MQNVSTNGTHNALNSTRMKNQSSTTSTNTNGLNGSSGSNAFNNSNGNNHITDSLLGRITDLLLDSEKFKQINDSNSVIEFKQPKELEKLLGFPLGEQATSDEEVMDFVNRVIKYSVKTRNPNFYNQLYGGIDDLSLAGSWITDALNTSSATYEISPVFTILERRLMKYLGSYCGWNEDSIDGIFAPGGSISNMFAMILSRYKKFPQVRVDGLSTINGQAVIFVSEDAHYSFLKGSMWMGHGSKSVIKVKTDSKGCMLVNDLKEKLTNALTSHQIPFMIVATAGTTVLSAFDPISELAKVAKHFNIWLHVDAALGGTVLFSQKYRSLMNGIELADSITWNLHKLGGIPLQCSAFITKHPTLLAHANCSNAEYLFQSDKYYDASYDSGDKSIQCGRKVDSLKLYLALLGRGSNKMELLVDNIFTCADYLTKKLQNHPNFRLVLSKFQCNNICFWYLPSQLIEEHKLDQFTNDLTGDQLTSFTQFISSQSSESKLYIQMSKICPTLKLAMMNDGKLMINYQPLTSKKLPNFFRMVLTCLPASTVTEMDFVIDHLLYLASTIDWSKVL